VLLATVLASSCSASDTVQQAPRTGSGGSSAPAGGSPSPTSAPGCPAKYAAPDPNRPRITLTFDLSADLSTVTGTERVRVVPDLPVREAVFRLTANGPTAAGTGSAVTVQRATAEPAGRPFRYERAGAAAGSVGGVLVIPLGREVPAGQPVTADVSF